MLLATHEVEVLIVKTMFVVGLSGEFIRLMFCILAEDISKTNQGISFNHLTVAE